MKHFAKQGLESGLVGELFLLEYSQWECSHEVHDVAVLESQSLSNDVFQMLAGRIPVNVGYQLRGEPIIDQRANATLLVFDFLEYVRLNGLRKWL